MAKSKDTTFEKYERFAKNMCILIPCHLKRATQIKDLIITLGSITRNQPIKVDILISVSFEMPMLETLFKKTMKKHKITTDPIITIMTHKKPMSEFRHIDYLGKMIWDSTVEYVMFCRCGDEYGSARIISFINILQTDDSKKYVAAYEQIDEKKPKFHFYPYWNYCCEKFFFRNFYATIDMFEGDEYIDNPHCFMLFSIYIAYLSECADFRTIEPGYYQKTNNIIDQNVFTIDINGAKVKVLDCCILGLSSNEIKDELVKFKLTEQETAICMEYSLKLRSYCCAIFGEEYGMEAPKI